MNVLKFLVFLLLFSFSCKKDAPDTFRVLGSLRDVNTQEPISGVTMTAYTSGGDFNDAWNGTLHVVIRGSEKTDANGDFDFEFIKNQLETVYLGCPDIPGNYSADADLNGTSVNLYLDLKDFYANRQPAVIEDAVYYNVKLSPK